MIVGGVRHADGRSRAADGRAPVLRGEDHRHRIVVVTRLSGAVACAVQSRSVAPHRCVGARREAGPRCVVPGGSPARGALPGDDAVQRVDTGARPLDAPGRHSGNVRLQRRLGGAYAAPPSTAPNRSERHPVNRPTAMVHVWMTRDLASAYAHQAPAQALQILPTDTDPAA